GVGRARAASAALLDRVVNATVNRGGGNGGTGGGPDGAPDEREVEAAEPTESVLADVGVDRAAALALGYDDDETNTRAALTARRLNPRPRLVLRRSHRPPGRPIQDPPRPA